MKQRALSGFAASGLLCGAVIAACAGSVTPPVDEELADAVEASFNGGAGPAAGGAAATGNAGAAGANPSNDTDSGGAAGAAVDSGGAAGSGDSGGAAGSGDSGGAAGAGGAPDEGGAGAGGGEPPCDGFAILAANCGSSGCHGEGSNLGTFAASEEDALEYIGQPGAVCSNQGSIIDTENPAASLMVTKLSDDPPCAQPMPLGGQPLSQADIECIEDWIGGL